MEAPTIPTTCDRCGKQFNTVEHNPRRYCSISCEENRGSLPKTDPSSEGYHLHLQGEPSALVGKTLVATALKRTCYSPEWHKSPSDYNPRNIRQHDEESEIIVYETTAAIGAVVDYEDGQYVVEHEDIATGEVTTRRIPDSTTVSQIRQDTWWANE